MEYAIIKLSSSRFNDALYIKLLKALKQEDLNIVKVTTFMEQNSISHFDLVDISSRYFVMLVYGENASLKVNKLANDFNRSIDDDDENKIYVSSNDSLEYDAIKYFSKSLNQIIGESNLTNYKQNQSEQTLAIIKPDAMSHRKEIIKMITDSGLIIRKYKVEVLSADLLREHYAHVAEEPFYPSLESYMSSGPVVILLVEGENAVKRLRDLVGPTDSRKAPSNTIRGKFGTDAKLNAIHASDSIENAEKEINRFFKQKSKVLKLK